MAYAVNRKPVTFAEWSNSILCNNVDGEYKFHEPKPNSVSLHAGADEMIRIAEDGFYVRGVKVPVDDKEAETVYRAFNQWLAWANLQRK